MDNHIKDKVLSHMKNIGMKASALYKDITSMIKLKLNQHQESIDQDNNTIDRSNEMSNWEADIEVRTISPNILIKILNVLTAILEVITGTRRSGKMVETDDYLSLNTKTQILFFFLKSEEKTKLAKNRISGFQVSTVKTWFIFKTNIIEIYGSGLQNLAYQVKVPYQELQEKAETWLKK
tara:strand:- start:34 stop:570 length:537 start_codon:yes stop_codon:yes gene_type:complete